MGKQVKDIESTLDLYSGSVFDSDLFSSKIKSYYGGRQAAVILPRFSGLSVFLLLGAKVGFLKC